MTVFTSKNVMGKETAEILSSFKWLSAFNAPDCERNAQNKEPVRAASARIA